VRKRVRVDQGVGKVRRWTGGEQGGGGRANRDGGKRSRRCGGGVLKEGMEGGVDIRLRGE